MTKWQRFGMYLFGMGVGIQVGLSINGIAREHPFALTIMSTVALAVIIVGFLLGFSGSAEKQREEPKEEP